MNQINQQGSCIQITSTNFHFVQSRGITASEIRRRADERAAAAVEAAAAAAPATAETLDTSNSGARTSVATPTTRRTRRTAAEESEAGPSTQAASTSTGKRVKKRKKKDSDDWNPYSKSIPVPGQIDFCAECNCRFTVTAYSRSGPDGDGLLCNTCGARGAKAQRADKKKAVQVKKAKQSTAQSILDGSNGGPKSLRELCINVSIHPACTKAILLLF